MNLESMPSKKAQKPTLNDEFSMEEFDFKPITSGLGFHQTKSEEPKIAMMEKVIPNPIPQAPVAREMNVYQNDLSIFYSQQTANLEVPVQETKEEVSFRVATKSQRAFAYLIDLTLVASVVSLVLIVMARTISMDLIDVWISYPNEITPLVVTLFCGFYLMYFSIFDKTETSTLGKNLFGIRVVDQSNLNLSFTVLFLRSFVTLLNFVSLGLFSYFDLQNKMFHSKVVRID